MPKKPPAPPPADSKPAPKFDIGDKVRRAGGPGTGTIASIRYYVKDGYTYEVNGFGSTSQSYKEATLRKAV